MRFNTNNDTILVCMFAKAKTIKSHLFKCVFYVFVSQMSRLMRFFQHVGAVKLVRKKKGK